MNDTDRNGNASDRVATGGVSADGGQADRVRRLVRQHWDGRAATFDDEPQHGIHGDDQRERWLTLLDEWTGDPAGQTLDVGCGTGVVSLLLAELGHDVVGLDAAPAMLDRARQKAVETGRDVALALGDATQLGLRDDAAALLVERHLLWTLPDPTATIGEWRRVVEPGGRIVLFEGKWNHEELRGEYETVADSLPMYHGRSPAEMREFLAAQGLVDVAYESLRDPVLWGREPRHHKYVIGGTVPE